MDLPAPGTRVRVRTKDGQDLEGIVQPAEDRVVLKLDNGYNAGVDESSLENVEVLSEEAPKERPNVPTQVPEGKDSPRILILHTGGTIASKVDYATGGVTNLIEPDELLALYPELQRVAKVEARFLANMSSDDMRFAHYNRIAEGVAKAVGDGYAGIIVSQGTDTLHYTAAALHYALRHVPVPVVLVGSQRSSDRGSADAASNLLGACRFIAEEGVPGVFVAMHAGLDDDTIAIMRGVNVRKSHTSRRDAFKPINLPPVALVRPDGIERTADVPQDDGEFSVQGFREDLRVGMCYAHPNMHPEEFACYEGFDGLVVIGTGLGHTPINVTDDATEIHAENERALRALAERLPVVMTSQCINGRVNLQVYSAGRKHQEMGIIGHDLALTPETAFIKLAWLLTQERDPAEGMQEDFGDRIPRVEERAYDE